MARGPKKHLKRLAAPKSWMLHKLGGIWAPRPSEGPHKLRESFPLSLILRNRLRYALTRREITMITARRLIKVDNKVRTDINYPCGFQDVISIDKTSDLFRVLYDVKGRFILHKISPEEAKYKLAKVVTVNKAKKSSIGRNPLHTGQAGVIPYLVTHDGRTIRYPDPAIHVNDVVRINLEDGKIIGQIKFQLGGVAMATRGANIGRIGTITGHDKHPGSFDVVHLKDARGAAFATRLRNVFVLNEGKQKEETISFPKGNGIKLSIIEERERGGKRSGGKVKKQKA